MKLTKIVEAAKTASLNKLVAPEITVVTRDSSGLIQVWWTNQTGPADWLRQSIWDSMFLTKGGAWASTDYKAEFVELGHDMVTGYPISRTYKSLEKRIMKDNTKEGYEFLSSQFVGGLLSQLISMPDPNLFFEKEPEPQENQYEIKTKYEVDTVEFDTLEQAQKYVKGAKLFDLILKGDPEADYFDYQTAIETMLDNEQLVIDILKGK